MVEQIAFVGISILVLGSALVTVTNRNLFHAALALMLSFLGVAGYYLLLGAGFLAMAQLLVYIGAISILIIFAIMMTRHLMNPNDPAFNSQAVWGGIGAIVTLAILVFTIVRSKIWPVAPDPTQPFGAVTPVEDVIIANSFEALGRSFVNINEYVIVFEVASVLLLAALIGAIAVAWPKQEDPS